MQTINYSPTKRFFLLVMVATILALGLLPKAHAGSDGKQYPGWMCRAESSVTAQYLRYHYAGGITNTSSTNTYYVLCPILRDTRYSFRAIDHAAIFYSDNHPTESLTCGIAVRRGDTAKIISGKSNLSPVGIKSQSVFIINGPKTVSIANYPMEPYYSMRCAIPPKTSHGASILQGYYVHERD